MRALPVPGRWDCCQNGRMVLIARSPNSEEEVRAHRTVIDTAFGDIPGEPDQTLIDQHQAMIEEAHTVAVVKQADEEAVGEVGEKDEIIGGLFGAEFYLTLPGGNQVSAVGLAGVGINPARVGRGGLGVMMEEHLRRSVDRGLAASTLWASESGLYGRFGYGPATTMAIHELRSGAAEFTRPMDDAGHSDLIFDPVEAHRLVAEVYAKMSTLVPGTTSRSEAWWEVVLTNSDGWLATGPRLTLVHWNAAGDPDGYAFYKLVEPHGGDSWICDGLVSVREFVGLDIEAERALLAFLMRIPLCRRVRLDMSPVDSLLRHQLADQRQFHQIEAHDGLWLRPLNVARLLTERSYETSGEVSIEIDDPLFEDQRGPWLLSVTGDSAGERRATVTRTKTADLVLTPGQLGATVLGNTRVNELTDAGLIEGDNEAVAELDRLMLARRKPFAFSKF